MGCTIFPYNVVITKRLGFLVIVCMLVMPGFHPAGSDEPESSEAPSKNTSTTPVQERVEQLLDTIKSEDKEESLRAEQELLSMGQKALPAIKRRLKSSESGVYYRLLQQIQSLYSVLPGKMGLPGSPERSPEQFSLGQNVQSLRQSLRNMDPPENEALLLKRFREAVDKYKSGQHREALTLSQAILIIAPDVSFASKLKRFMRKCKQHLFNTSTLKATLSTDSTQYAWDETIEVTCRIKNVTDKPVTVDFESRNPPAPGIDSSSDQENSSDDGGREGNGTGEGKGKGRSERTSNPKKQDVASSSREAGAGRHIVLEYRQTKIGLRGNQVTENGYQEVSVPGKVQIPPGASWERTVTFDSSSFEHAYVLRRITLRGRVAPSLIRVGEERFFRWLIFRPASFELFPRGIREAQPVTTEKIKRHLRAGHFRDVFFLTLLRPETEPETLTKLFLRVLPFLKRQNARTIMFLLQELTGEGFYYNREEWLNWGRETYDISVQPPEENDDNNPVPNFDR